MARYQKMCHYITYAARVATHHKINFDLMSAQDQALFHELFTTLQLV